MHRASKNRLTSHHLSHFAGTTLFDALGRAVCGAGCLPRKELHEAWEMGRRVHRRYRGRRIVDLACGHGLLALVLLLLDDTAPGAIAVDLHLPKSAGTLLAALGDAWPRLRERIQFREADLMDLPLTSQDLIVSAHACGALTDRVLERAVAAGAAVAVLPCCHHLKGADLGGLEGWLEGPLALDAARVARLRAEGYQVHTQTIPGDITPKNRLLLAAPA